MYHLGARCAALSRLRTRCSRSHTRDCIASHFLVNLNRHSPARRCGRTCRSLAESGGVGDSAATLQVAAVSVSIARGSRAIRMFKLQSWLVSLSIGPTGCSLRGHLRGLSRCDRRASIRWRTLARSQRARSRTKLATRPADTFRRKSYGSALSSSAYRHRIALSGYLSAVRAAARF